MLRQAEVGVWERLYAYSPRPKRKCLSQLQLQHQESLVANQVVMI